MNYLIGSFGRPEGSGEWGFTKIRSYRISIASHLWWKQNGGRPYIEKSVPLDFRLNIEEQLLRQVYPSITDQEVMLRLQEIMQQYN